MEFLTGLVSEAADEKRRLSEVAVGLYYGSRSGVQQRKGHPMMRARQVEHHEVLRAKSAGARQRGPTTPSTISAMSLIGGCFALLLGCNGPDPEGKYEDFVDETQDDRDIPPAKEDIATIEGDISGDFLLAVATTVDIDKPLQFIATNTVTLDPEGKQMLKVSLQPLSLEQGKVTTPRMPVGDPLVYENIPVVDGKFILDAGTVMVTGMANPITGSDIVASLIMNGNIMGEDLYCGGVTGDVMSPLMVSIEGSTFAAVRLTDVKMLPDPVVVDCEGRAVTNP